MPSPATRSGCSSPASLIRSCTSPAGPWQRRPAQVTTATDALSEPYSAVNRVPAAHIADVATGRWSAVLLQQVRFWKARSAFHSAGNRIFAEPRVQGKALKTRRNRLLSAITDDLLSCPIVPTAQRPQTRCHLRHSRAHRLRCCRRCDLMHHVP
jgi:hypothetical protein